MRREHLFFCFSTVLPNLLGVSTARKKQGLTPLLLLVLLLVL